MGSACIDTSLHDHELKLAWGKRTTTLSGRRIMSRNQSRNYVEKFGLNYAVCKELIDWLINKSCTNQRRDNLSFDASQSCE